MDRFDTMLAFTRVAELSSFTKAALSLNLPKATVSAQVLALEKRLQVKLLYRTTRHVRVTADGAAYYERAVRLLAELDETEAAVRHVAQAPKGRLRVDVPGSIGQRLLIPALCDFFTRYPEIELEMGCTDRPVDLLHEGIDCVIRGGEVHDETLVARRLGNLPLLTCASPVYLERYGTPATLADLDQHVMVHMFSPKTGKLFPFEFIIGGVRQIVYGSRKVSFNDAEACVSAALTGLGIAQLGSFVAEREIAAGRLQRVLPEIEVEGVPLYILYLQNRHLSNKVRVFVDWVAELLIAGKYVLPTGAQSAPPRP